MGIPRQTKGRGAGKSNDQQRGRFTKEFSVKTLAQLQAECAAIGLKVTQNGKAKKDDYIQALRRFRWDIIHPNQPMPPQVMPMLLGSWEDLTDEQAAEIEREGSGWIVQPKLDGVRCLLHVEGDRVRLTSRCISEITYRLNEFQENVPHLTRGWSVLDGTILDGELVCPVAELDTGKSNTAHPLQAAVAILATSPDNAAQIQKCHNAHLRLHVFDILRHRGTDVINMPLRDRLDLVESAVGAASNPHLEVVPSYVINKSGIHDHIIASGGEGSVWKQIDRPYEPGRRVKHWIKRKRGLEIEAFVTGFKPGTPERGHAHLVGAVEFSRRGAGGNVQPVAWVSGWTDAERQAMTDYDAAGNSCLRADYLSRSALISGQDFAAKSQRLRHARLIRWMNERFEDNEWSVEVLSARLAAA